MTRHTEAETRRIKKLRMRAANEEKTVLEDVDIDKDFKKAH